MRLEYRPYVCTVCGHHDSIQTNHEGPVLHYCKGCSWKPSFGKGHKIPQLGNHTYREFHYDPSVNEELTKNKNMPPKLSNIKKLKKTMTLEQKKRVLKVLKSLREETGNVGGETDITNADNLQTNENEFTNAQPTPERNVVAKTFDTQADFDSYANQRRGIEMTPKELQAIQNYREAKPAELDRFHVKFETTDDFGNNTTTIIKKLKEGNQFCWTAFSKHETAEDEGKPDGEMEPALQEATPGQAAMDMKDEKPSNEPSEPEEDPGDEEVTVNDPIRITKSITFVDETQGADILADFVEKLEV